MKLESSYAKSLLSLAIYDLATLPGDVRSRLRYAFLQFHTIREDDFPEFLRKDWKWVMWQLTKFGPKVNDAGIVWMGAVANTMSKIRNGTGVKIADKICEVESKLEGYLSDHTV